MKNNYRLYQSSPYYDMKSNTSNFGCGCNPCNSRPSCFPNFSPQPICNQPLPIPQDCSCNELLYLLSGIIIGRTLH